MPKIYMGGYQPVEGYASTYFLQDATYFRLKNVQIGYNLPAKILNVIKIEQLRVYCAADNLFLISKFPGFDPERTSSTDTYVAYPQNRTFTFGATIQF
jgi:hypothetical protein